MCLEDYPRCVKLCNKVDLTDSFPLARARAEGIATVMTARPLRLHGGESDYYATDCAHTNFGIGSDEDGVRGAGRQLLPRRGDIVMALYSYGMGYGPATASSASRLYSYGPI